MSNNVVLFLTKVLAVMFLTFGVMSLAGVGLGLLAAASANSASSMATSAGYTVPGIPASDVINGSFFLALAIGVLYVISSFGLFKKTSWAYMTVGLVGIIGIVTFFTYPGSNPISLVWSAMYLGFAYVMSTKKKLFK